MSPAISARVLVVDDQRGHRDKLTLAVRALGHEAEAVDGGARALARLAVEPFDLVLLDILMPDMDGFEVMAFMQRDHRLRDIPVIVVSALESEMDAVVRAIESGAEDMLPKRFDAVLLAARLDAALERRRAHLHESDLRRHVQRLTDAAGVLERHPLDPPALNLAETCRREDAIGRLARVFVQMARVSGERERRLSHQLVGLRTAGLALVIGAVLGLAPPLSHLALLDGHHPLGIALWLCAFCALVCLPSVLWRPRLPGTALARGRLIVALAASGPIGGALPLLWLADELPASALAALLPAEAAACVAIGALRRRPTRPRLAALGLVTLALLSQLAGPFAATSDWRAETLAAALALPLCWAVHARLAAHALDIRTGAAGRADALALVGLAAFTACLCLAPLAVALDALVPLSGALPGVVPLEPSAGAVAATGAPPFLVLVLLGAVLAAGLTFRLVLAREAGAEAAAASSLAVALAAFAWSVLLGGERPPLNVWPAIGLFAAALAVRVASTRRRRAPPVTALDIELG